MNKKIKLTEEQINALKVIANSDFDLLDAIRSITHSASIRKGYKQPKLVSDEIAKVSGLIRNELEVFIPYDNIEIPDNYSQSSGYTVDVYVETKNQILLIDPKGVEHNNNTPISDEVKKWVMAKEQIQKNNPKKIVRFILLKPIEVNPNSFNRLKLKYNQFGIELFITDEFLSELRNKKVDVSTILRENKKTLMSSGILSLL
jgi:hypothetical protein